MNINLKQTYTPYALLPRAVFSIQKHSSFRLIVLLAYFYSMTMTESNFVRFSYAELRQILALKDPYTKKGNRTISMLIKTCEKLGFIQGRSVKNYSRAFLINVLEIPEIVDAENAPAGFFKFPKLVSLLPVSAQAKAVCVFLYSMQKKTSHRIFVSRARIRKVLKLKKQSLSKAFLELENAGVLKIEREKGRTNCYYLIPPAVGNKWNWPVLTVYRMKKLYPSHPLFSFFKNFPEVKVRYRLPLSLVLMKKTASYRKRAVAKSAELRQILQKVSRERYLLSRKPVIPALWQPLFDVLGKDAEIFVRMFFTVQERLGQYFQVRSPVGFLVAALKDRKILNEFLEKFYVAVGKRYG